ncbi:unnamed protein product [Owenia fusiformis]|uniref:SH3 domain-containing protein n=1 Tax=Owenia fusiformis TaxID=6347 RepID=A0A8S4NMT8_OWEFU|nr:unnamed protein product [Owenia fusiformis]
MYIDHQASSKVVAGNKATSQQTVSASSQKITKDAPPSTLVKGTKLLAKYNYKANKDSPLGETELSFKQKDNLMFLMVHPDNSHWWKCQNEQGMMGYVPGSYLYVVTEQPAGLPWLQGKKEEEVENKPDANNRFGAPPQGSFKPYVSAYNRNDQESKDLKLKAYYCAVCEKQLNGPQPYNAHMNSKAHKEEVELAEHYANK